MTDESLVLSATELAVSIRMDDTINPERIETFRSQLKSASETWREAGSLSTDTAAVLLELYPAIIGAAGSAPSVVDAEALELAESLLVDMLTALSP